MGYIDKTLVFDSDKIYYTDEGATFEVMMDWEDSIMKASADYVCENGGDILEIGFGMGISANYIQANDINSHTIIENHPQVIEKLQEWASDKPNVTIIQGDWSSVSGLSTYDGIFIDTYGDDNWNSFKSFALNKAKDGAKITYWNNFDSGNNEHSFDSISFENISISPDSNSYMNGNTYYMPKVVL